MRWYFEYDAKKSFGVTKSHLRFGDREIRSSYYVKKADFIGCHNETYLRQYDVVDELKPGGVLLLNTSWSAAELERELPGRVKRTLAELQARLYIINAVKIAAQLGLGNHYNLVLQAAFFRLAGIIPLEEAKTYMKELARRTYFAKGEEVVKRNCDAIDAGCTALEEIAIPSSWLNAPDEKAASDASRPEVVTKLADPINRQKGDDLPVSAFAGYEDGVIDMGLTAYEKRGIAVNVPVWDSTKCLQCNQCSLVCPHAVIRPYLLNEEERAAAPAGFDTLPVRGKPGWHFSLQASLADCTGCGACVNACPAKEKALTMRSYHEVGNRSKLWQFAQQLSDKGDVFDVWTVKGSQFRRPLLEFSAACAGCGETPYAKLLTQLFGDRVYWANATGCSQAWGSPMPGIPYTVNASGRGPAWSNSLFENNAEFALGMLLSVKQQRRKQQQLLQELAALPVPEAVKEAVDDYLRNFDDFDGSRRTADRLCAVLEQAALTGRSGELAAEVLDNRDQLARKTFWMFGGDGWAYDIGFGGLDHVIASGENINVLIVDTEVYSNTGGQSSKATPVGAVAQFASSGKASPKKDLGSIFMTYGNVYVAQVAMGANPNQLLKALREAEDYPGPSVIIAYTPCLAHGLKCGMGNAQSEMKRAVESGYWVLYRYNPAAEKPFTLDSAEPRGDFEAFLAGETRYSALTRTFPEHAVKYFARGREEAARRYRRYLKMAENQ